MREGKARSDVERQREAVKEESAVSAAPDQVTVSMSSTLKRTMDNK